ncbi:hypothetical protein E2C01_018401 [Portunus trituberculatus]|uniref:Uncharacterized protein n=1 Tax=Portunus trituberculatus TaxID=210409 RepID=A0A5B7DWC9_PORTR|nr:hypothetical protein [Portunus trituberculatus]
MAEDLGLLCIFAHSDEAIYCKMVLLQWLHEGRYEKVVNLLGGFHTIMVKLKIMYKKYGTLGFREWCVDAGAIAEGSETERRKQGLKPPKKRQKREDTADADESHLASVDDISSSAKSDSDFLFSRTSEISDRDAHPNTKFFTLTQPAVMHQINQSQGCTPPPATLNLPTLNEN